MKTASSTILAAASSNEVIPATASAQAESLVPDPTVPHNQPTLAFGGWPPRAGKIRPAVLFWALGVPIPLVLLFFLIRGWRA